VAELLGKVQVLGHGHFFGAALYIEQTFKPFGL
jgi:hypothetical protein